eukprot:274533-Amphidinium_carterae.1
MIRADRAEATHKTHWTRGRNEKKRDLGIPNLRKLGCSNAKLHQQTWAETHRPCKEYFQLLRKRSERIPVHHVCHDWNPVRSGRLRHFLAAALCCSDRGMAVTSPRTSVPRLDGSSTYDTYGPFEGAGATDGMFTTFP